MTQKVRVYEVARELGLDQRDLVTKIASLGIPVRNHMSALEPVDIDRVKRSLEKDKAEKQVEERIRPTVVRRRTIAREEPASAAVAAAPAPAPQPPPVAAPPPPVEARPVEVRRADSGARAIPEEVEAPPTNGRAAAVAEARPPTPPPAAPPPSGTHPVPTRPSMAPAEQPVRRAPLSAAERLGHANLPPGVVARGNSIAPGPASGGTSRTTPHAAPSRPQVVTPGPMGSEPPRRRELGRSALGPTGRQQPGRVGTKRRGPPGMKKGAKPEITVPSAEKRVIRIEETINLQELARRMSLKATDVLMKLMQLGMSGVNINSALDADTAKILASEFAYEVQNVAKSEDDVISEARGQFADVASDRVQRPPVVTVMGHVDHGKTSLLDRIRKSDVASGEAGGITQHIGAYRVDTEKGTLVFLDTPGHEAFTAMRARGGQAADVVILVVAADDGVMPQTKEAINHARAAEVPIVVAVNKIDKPEARAEVVRRELANEGLQPEDWGGDTMFFEVSAKTGKGIDALLAGVLLQAEVLELDSNPSIPAEGVILESYLDKGRGPVANVLVQNGTLRTGDHVIAGTAWGKIRAMTDDRNRPASAAGPSTPVEVLGLSEIPSAGDAFYTVTDARKAQEITQGRRTVAAGKVATTTKVGLDQIHAMMQAGETQELRLVIKADVQGSIEAVVKALTDLSTDKVKVNVIHTGVGGITENDVMLASASNAVIIGFNVRPAGAAASTAKSENIDIRTYSIIYEAVDEVRKAMAGLLAPKFVEKSLGKVEIRKIFNIPKVGTIAGCFVTEGKVQRSAKVRLVRDSVQVWEGSLASLRRVKDDVREVGAGYECGIGLAGFNDLKERDILECFELEEVAATL